jgi:hypothetical protein
MADLDKIETIVIVMMENSRATIRRRDVQRGSASVLLEKGADVHRQA